MMIDRRELRLVLANCALLAVVGCSRDTPPAYVPPPPPTSEPALPAPPATASGQQLAIA